MARGSEENQLAQINSFLDIQRIMLKCWALQVTALTTLPMIWKGVPSADPQGVLLYSLDVVSNDQSDPIYSHVWVCSDLRGVLLSMCVAKVAKQWSSKESRLSQISSFSDQRRRIMLATDCQDWAPTMFWFQALDHKALNSFKLHLWRLSWLKFQCNP